MKLCSLLIAASAFAKVDHEPAHLRHGHKHHAQMTGQDVQSREVQNEVERMVDRVKHLEDPQEVIQFAQEINTVEVAQEAIAEKAGDRKMVKEIDATRADLCVAEGFAAHQFAACDGFMRAACDPSVAPELKVPKQKCIQFFQDEQEAVLEGLAPAAAPSGAPGGSGAPGPALFGGKSNRPLPDQGYHGKKVIHKDFDTMTGDWHTEFGPKAGHRSYWEICADHPNNEWCCLHGYCPTPAPKPEEPKGIMEEIVDEVKKIVGPAPPPPPAPPAAPAPPPPPPPAEGAGAGGGDAPEEAPADPFVPFTIPTTTPPPWLFPWAQFLLFLLLLTIAIVVCINVCGQ